MLLVGIMKRAAAMFGFATRAEVGTPGPASGVVPPPRSSAPTFVSVDDAVTISDVYRGIQIIGTSVGQLTLDQYRGRDRLAILSPIAARPQLDAEAAHFFEETTTDLATCGNAYWRKMRNFAGAVVELRKLDPREVTVARDVQTDVLEYFWRGRKIVAADMAHLKLFRRTGYPLGLGPIQAAQIELRGTIEARDYSSTWMTETDVPSGILSTDQVLTPELAKTYKSIWRGDGEELPNGHQVRVVGSGLKYTPLLLKPADVQFLETRQYNKGQLADLLGIPLSLLHASMPGSSQTYQNVEQEWIAYNRFTLMAYLRPMEIALSAVLPNLNTVRFNVDALLRSDTKTRYESHEIAIRAGIKTIDEVRADEGLPSLPADAAAPEQPALEAA